MKKSVLPILLCGAVFVSCQKKALPVITERRQETPVVLPVNENIAPDTSAGKTIFLARCARCHDLPLPDQYTAPRWEGILSSMMPKARLSKEQEVHITAYLKAHAAK
ncbi:MAG: hypothetical protein ABIT05_14330 [Chitinophagaceae bacterium]